MTTVSAARSACVTLSKEVDADSYHLPAVVYEFESDCDSTVHLRVAERLPGDLGPEHIGFHPAHGSDYWRIDDGVLTFERDLDPGDTYTTILGVHPHSSNSVSDLVRPPTRFTARPTGPPAPVLGGTDSFTRSASAPEGVEQAVTAGERSSGATAAIDEQTFATAASNARTLQSRLEAAGRSQDDSHGSADDAADAPTRVVVNDGANPLSDGRPAENGTAGEHGRSSVDARIRHLQTAVADLEAYTDALEGFLDERGAVETILSEFEADQEAQDAELAVHTRRLDDHQQTLETVTDRTAGQDDRIDAIADDLQVLREEMQEVQARVSRLEDRLPAGDPEDRISTLESRVEAQGAFVDRLRTAFE